jgi:hypothetical protein
LSANVTLDDKNRRRLLSLSKCRNCVDTSSGPAGLQSIHRWPLLFSSRWRARGSDIRLYKCSGGLNSRRPKCAHCGCKVFGHGVEADGVFYCCAHCANVPLRCTCAWCDSDFRSLVTRSPSFSAPLRHCLDSKTILTS